MLRSVSNRWGGFGSKETDIVSTQNTNDLAAAVQLDKEPLVEVLFAPSSALVRGGGREEACGSGWALPESLSPTISIEERAHTFLSSGCAGAMVNFSSKRSWRMWCGCWCGCWFPRCNAQGAGWTRVRLATVELEISTGSDWPDPSRVEPSTSDKIRTELCALATLFLHGDSAHPG
jgi:hypothetical protein